MENVKCPKCGSTQITANKKGFSGKKAVAGAMLTGGVGLLAGTIGSNNIIITCLSCGHHWDLNKQVKRNEQQKDVQNHDQYIKSKQEYADWKTRWYNAYEKGEYDEVASILKEKHIGYNNVHEAYKKFKAAEASDKKLGIVLYLVFVIVVVLIIWAAAA